MCLVGENGLRGNSPKMDQLIPSQRTSVDRQAHSTVPSAAPHGYAARPNSATSSGRIADSLVEWHFVGEDQACLVPVSDWPMRALVREQYRPYHDRQILSDEPEAAATILAIIDARGPLSSLEFEDQSRFGEPDSWYGLTRTKRILRSLWVCGQLVTHHRVAGRHYYDRPARVIPAQYFAAPPLLDTAEY